MFLLCISQANAQCTAIINTFPYQESFESGTANWVSGGLNNDWAWGSPSKPVITGAGAGNNCWITGGLTASFYNYGERSWVESPCFDFTTLDRPYVSFLIFWDTERSYDGGNFQYSLDLGVTWKNAGAKNDPVKCNDQNWFNISSVTNLSGFVNNTQGWSGTTQTSSGSCSGSGGSGAWKLASHCLKILANKPSVKFRFTFGSGTTCNNYDGIAFDDFYINNAPTFPDDFSYTCTGGNKVNFTDINPDCHTTWDWDFGDAASSSNTATGNSVNHDFSSGGIYTVTLNTGGGCSVDTQIVNQVRILSATFQSTPVSCIGDSDGSAQVIVTNQVGAVTYSWSHDPSLNSALATGLKAQDYTVSITDPGTCTLSFQVMLDYGPGAFPVVSLGKDTFICPGSQFDLYPGSFSAYRWQDNSTDSFLVVRTAGIYSVYITNTSGCNASDTLDIKEDCIQDIILPNAFTPNGDGLNETFNALGSETSEFKIYIYDRWGELIFSTGDRNRGWDGSLKGRPVQEGFYNYLINYSISGEDRIKKGSVFVIR